MARFFEDDIKSPASGPSTVQSPGPGTSIQDLLFAQHHQPTTMQSSTTSMMPPGFHHVRQPSLGQSGTPPLAKATAPSPSFDQADDIRTIQMHMSRFQESDRMREELFTRIWLKYQEVCSMYDDKCRDWEQEHRSLGMFQRENLAIKAEMDQIKRANESNPLVFVVLDGDAAVFRDDLLRGGEEGGAHAASLLVAEIKSFLQKNYPGDGVDDWNIIVQVFVNRDGLARTLQSAGVLHDGVKDFAAFTQGFGQGNSLTSFIDVGSGKERVDHKIRETLRVMVRLHQCKHIIFGPCRDNGYLTVLEPYKRDPNIATKMTLLDTVPALHGFIQLGFPRITFPDVFRSEMLTVPNRNPLYPFMSHTSGPPVGMQLATRNGSMPGPAPVANSGFMLRPYQPPSQPVPSTVEAASAHAAQALASLLPPASAPPQPQAQIQPPPPPPQQQSPPPLQPLPPTKAAPATNASSWATVGNTVSVAATTINIAPKKQAPPRKYYFVNAESERLDEELPRVNNASDKRYKEKMQRNGKNFCNKHHLLGYCDDEEYCDYVHGDPLPPGEMLVQQHRARGTYCAQGIGCESFDCYYGHHCRYGRDCGVGYKCKFNDTHHMNLTKAVKVYDDNTREDVRNAKN